MISLIFRDSGNCKNTLLNILVNYIWRRFEPHIFSYHNYCCKYIIVYAFCLNMFATGDESFILVLLSETGGFVGHTLATCFPKAAQQVQFLLDSNTKGMYSFVNWHDYFHFKQFFCCLLFISFKSSSKY